MPYNPAEIPAEKRSFPDNKAWKKGFFFSHAHFASYV